MIETAAAATIDPITEGVGNIFLSQGLLGAIVIALVYFILMLRSELRDTRAAHKVEIAAKDALINELQEQRLKEARVGFEIANQSKATLDAFLTALRGKGHP
ncbi:hypothetical protein [Mesorhizobium sp. M2A.F.Ca.ET.039.01.1.1]|uniref:hypothetical protein n=1 Tax=Mesorhizobium sp. M2A.F.Ca.ET.039.01.1.1 TaxID=2496746 RepID=UPI000FCB5BEB|nr:hypothetical protein [Mesorhizobium sp. M2A.F.Ca.ET.039.01.1.1]RWX72615.1 hypothetical protein EOA24_00075 [Mesorhizobium sp. M2A.F.Ca.ET.039.01.1.1]